MLGASPSVLELVWFLAKLCNLLIICSDLSRSKWDSKTLQEYQLLTVDETVLLKTGGNWSFLWDYLFTCFGLLMTSILGLKAMVPHLRASSLTCDEFLRFITCKNATNSTVSSKLVRRSDNLNMDNCLSCHLFQTWLTMLFEMTWL